MYENFKMIICVYILSWVWAEWHFCPALWTKVFACTQYWWFMPFTIWLLWLFSLALHIRKFIHYNIRKWNCVCFLTENTPGREVNILRNLPGSMSLSILVTQSSIASTLRLTKNTNAYTLTSHDSNDRWWIYDITHTSTWSIFSNNSFKNNTFSCRASTSSVIVVTFWCI